MFGNVLNQGRYLQVVAGQKGKEPGHICQIGRLVARCGADQWQPGLGHHLFGQVSAWTVDSSHDGPHPIVVNQPHHLAHAGSPRILAPRRHEAEWFSSITAVGVGLVDGQASGAPHVTAGGMLWIAGAEVAEQHFGHIVGRTFLAAWPGVLGRLIAEDEKGGGRGAAGRLFGTANGPQKADDDPRGARAAEYSIALHGRACAADRAGGCTRGANRDPLASSSASGHLRTWRGTLHPRRRARR